MSGFEQMQSIIDRISRLEERKIADDLLNLYSQFEIEVIDSNKNYTDDSFSFDKFMRWLSEKDY